MASAAVGSWPLPTLTAAMGSVSVLLIVAMLAGGVLRWTAVGVAQAILSATAGVAWWCHAPPRKPGDLGQPDRSAAEAPSPEPGRTIAAVPGPDVGAAVARLEFDTRFERALDAAGNEEELLGVVTRATESLLPPAPTELLLAAARGSSMVQVAESGPEGEGPGCPVAHPGECEAMRVGQTRLYPASTGFDACPHLRGRVRPCAAVCVPVRVVGQTIGVLHRTAPVDSPPDAAVVATLESMASKAGARLSLLRAAAPPTAVRTDPATGTLDRASTEQHIVELARNLVPFSLAQGDIDRFEAYVARHGPDAADRAVRLVGRTLQEVLRPSDIVGRFGDDEFLVVLPHASHGQAQRALERAREHLVLAFTELAVPPFTVSFGVVESSFGQSLDDLLVGADVAVSLAKDLGRNRVVVASEQLMDPHLLDGEM